MGNTNMMVGSQIIIVETSINILLKILHKNVSISKRNIH